MIHRETVIITLLSPSRSPLNRAQIFRLSHLVLLAEIGIQEVEPFPLIILTRLSLLSECVYMSLILKACVRGH